MKLTIILIGLLLIAGGVAVCVILNLMRLKKWDDEAAWGRRQGEELPKKPRASFLPLLISVVGLIVLIAGNSFTIVPTGYTGVRTTFGLIDQESCMPGFNALTPFIQKVNLVNNKQQDIRIPDRIWSETTEQTVVYMEGTVVTYRIVPESSAWIYANVENWVEELIDADIVSSALKTASRTLGADVVTDRAVIEPLSKDTLQSAVNEKYGENRVEIKNVIINNIDFEESYNAAIAKKSAAIQEQQEQAIRNQTDIEKAQAQADAKRAAAEGEADAERIKAQGKADANKVITSSVTDETLHQDAIDKWDGSLPRYIGSSDGAATFGILDAATD